MSTTNATHAELEHENANLRFQRDAAVKLYEDLGERYRALTADYAAVTAQRDQCRDALRPLVISEMGVCSCRPWGHGGPHGGGGSRNTFTREWVKGQHAADCPHEAARAALRACDENGGAK